MFTEGVAKKLVEVPWNMVKLIGFVNCPAEGKTTIYILSVILYRR
jgi:hypothetical protein